MKLMNQLFAGAVVPNSTGLIVKGLAGGLALLWGTSVMSATPSVNGANTSTQPSIVDSGGGSWAIVGGIVKRNGQPVGYTANATFLLEYNEVFYQRNSSDNWYAWNGSSWRSVRDPRHISQNGSRIGVGSGALVDTSLHVWSLPRDDYGYEDGVRSDSSYNTIALLYYDNAIYAENTSNEWFAWNGSSWTRASGDPTLGNTHTVSADGASIGVGTGTLVDAAGGVWTLPANEMALRNGSRAGNNANTILVLYHGAVIYSENSSGSWYSWNGSSWAQVAGNPMGPHLAQVVTYTSPVCPPSNPGCTPAFEGNSSVTFTRTTTKGDAIWVAATVSDYGGIHAIYVTDSQNNTYQSLGQENDRAPGSQSLAHFYAGNIAGGADTITVHWASDNYKGVVAAEIAGVKGSPLVGSAVAVQDGNLVPARDNVRSNSIPMTVVPTPSFVIALTMDTNGGGSDVGGTGYCAVPAGSGFKQESQVWNWAVVGQTPCNLGTLETKTLTSAGAAEGSFTSTHLTDPYVTVSAVFQ